MTGNGHENETARLRQLIMGFRTTQLVYVAAKLGLADHLASGPLLPSDLAQIVGANPDALYRLLRALASLGIFAELVDGRFAMTPAGALLRRDRPGTLHSTAVLYGDEVLWGAYGQLLHSVQTGKSAFAHLYGQSFYEYLDQHVGTATLFQNAMTGFSELEAAAIIAAFDLSSVRTMVDVGGGQGALAATLLRCHPSLHAVIFDRAAPAEETLEQLARPDIAGRGKFVQGDFFTAVPEGAELYLLKSVIHNWDDGSAAVILRTCAKAMLPDARLLIAERMIPPGNGPSEAKLFDINMLVTVGGRERTQAQYATILRSAGLRLRKVTPTASHLSLIEAEKTEQE